MYLSIYVSIYVCTYVEGAMVSRLGAPPDVTSEQPGSAAAAGTPYDIYIHK